MFLVLKCCGKFHILHLLSPDLMKDKNRIRNKGECVRINFVNEVLSISPSADLVGRNECQ